jgi:hypothetical protein
MRTETIDLKGKSYATVPQRIKEFREACPKGKIITKYEKIEGVTIFKAYVWKYCYSLYLFHTVMVLGVIRVIQP